MEGEIGRVVAVTGDMVRVEVNRSETCGACAARSACFVAGLEGRGAMTMDVSDPIGVQVDQEVRVVCEPKGRVKASFILYILPVISMLTGAILGNSLALRSGAQNPEIWSIGAGFSLFILSFLVIKAFSGHFERRSEYLPSIVEVVRE